MHNQPGPGGGPQTSRGEAAPQPRAGRVTTVLLAVTLALVVVLAGVLAAIAVLMTRNPDVPILSTPQIRRLATPIHFAPVTAVQPAPCEGMEAVLDEAGTTCYQVGPGVNVTAVQKIEPMQERDGTYAVRIVLAPGNREQLAELTQETVKQQLAIVVGGVVVAAPRVAQAITEDSLSLAGSFTREEAEALIARLLGTGLPATGQPGQPTAPGQPTVPGQPTAPAQPGQPTAPAQPGQPTVPGQPGQPIVPGQPGQQFGGPAAAGPPDTAQDGVTATGAPFATADAGSPAARRPDPRLGSCQEAVRLGYGPYTRGVHPEYDWYPDVDRDGVACDRDDLRG